LSAPIAIRDATRDDVGLLYSMVQALAEYERAPELVLGTAAMLEQSLFGPDPAAEAVIAVLDSEAAGFALFYTTFSTWRCRPGLWLEDLFVSPAHRRGGVGSALLTHVARIAVERNYPRMDWSALEWNESALRFYASIGATTLDEWRMLRLDDHALQRLGGDSQPVR
jgi:GNAT superfamily N-acetyltransferase